MKGSEISREAVADWLRLVTEDGKEMKLDLQKMKIQEIEVEVDRHSRMLRRAEDLSGN